MRSVGHEVKNESAIKVFSHLNFLIYCSPAANTIVWQCKICTEGHHGGHRLLHIFLCCRKYAPRCSVCSEPIMPEPGKDETVRVVALEKNFHMKCYKCEVSLLAPLLVSLPCSSSATGHLCCLS